MYVSVSNLINFNIRFSWMFSLKYIQSVFSYTNKLSQTFAATFGFFIQKATVWCGICILIMTLPPFVLMTNYFFLGPLKYSEPPIYEREATVQAIKDEYGVWVAEYSEEGLHWFGVSFVICVILTIAIIGYFIKNCYDAVIVINELEQLEEAFESEHLVMEGIVHQLMLHRRDKFGMEDEQYQQWIRNIGG